MVGSSASSASFEGTPARTAAAMSRRARGNSWRSRTYLSAPSSSSWKTATDDRYATGWWYFSTRSTPSSCTWVAVLPRNFELSTPALARALTASACARVNSMTATLRAPARPVKNVGQHLDKQCARDSDRSSALWPGGRARPWRASTLGTAPGEVAHGGRSRWMSRGSMRSEFNS